MKKKILFIAIIFLLLLFIPADSLSKGIVRMPPPQLVLLDVPAGNIQGRYESEVDYLDYWLHIPENAFERMPLIIFLHGDGEINAMKRLEHFGIAQAMEEIYGDEAPFILLTPNTRTYSWIKPNIEQTLMELINYIVKEYKIDTNRIIITGHSRGAIGTWHLISKYGNYFSCAVPVSCDYEQRDFDAERASEVPVWGFIGTIDDYSHYGKNMELLIQLINDNGGTASLTILQGQYHGSTSYAAYTEEVFTWMLTQ